MLPPLNGDWTGHYYRPGVTVRRDIRRRRQDNVLRQFDGVCFGSGIGGGDGGIEFGGSARRELRRLRGAITKGE
jgi:hypothetical protein